MLPRTPFRVALAALLVAVAIVAGVVGGIDFPVDVTLVRWSQELRAASPALTLAMIAVTHVGSAYGTIGGGLAASAWLAWKGERWRAMILAATVLFERLIIDGLKLVIDRTRPSIDLHPVPTHSSSFPSGHSGNSMAIFLAIALIAVPRAHRGRAVVVAVAASLLIGASRPYLGVHWPSDVVGGWATGAAIAIIAWTIAERRASTSAE